MLSGGGSWGTTRPRASSRRTPSPPSNASAKTSSRRSAGASTSASTPDMTAFQLTFSVRGSHSGRTRPMDRRTAAATSSGWSWRRKAAVSEISSLRFSVCSNRSPSSASASKLVSPKECMSLLSDLHHPASAQARWWAPCRYPAGEEGVLASRSPCSVRYHTSDSVPHQWSASSAEPLRGPVHSSYTVARAPGGCCPAHGNRG